MMICTWWQFKPDSGRALLFEYLIRMVLFGAAAEVMLGSSAVNAPIQCSIVNPGFKQPVTGPEQPG